MHLRNLAYTTTALVLAALLLIAAMLAFFSRPLLLYSANRLLADSNIVITSLDDLRFNSQQFSVARIELTELSSQSRGSITDLVVSYSLAELFQGRIKNIEINTLLFDWQPQDETSTEQVSSRQESPLAMLASLRSLPFDSLAIKQIGLPPFLESATVAVEKNAREVRVTFNSDGNFVEAYINWHNEQYTSAYFIPDTSIATQDFSAPIASGSLAIKHQREASALISFTLSELTGTLIAELDAELHLLSINALLLELGLWSAPELAMEGKAHITMTATDPGTTSKGSHLSIGGTASVDATVRQLDANGISSTLTLFNELPALEFQADYAEDQLSFNIITRDATINIASEFSSLPILAQIDIKALALRCSTTTHCKGSINSTTHFDEFAIQGVATRGLQLTSNIAVEGSASDAGIRIENGTEFSAISVSMENAASDNSTFEVMTPILLRIKNRHTINLDGGALRIHLPRVTASDISALLTLQIDQLKGSVDLQNLQAAKLSTEILLRELQSDIMPGPLPKASVSLTIDADILSGTGSLFIAGQPVINVSANHNTQNNQGEAFFVLAPLDLSTPSPAVDETLNRLPFSVALASGIIQGDTKIQWNLSDEQWRYAGPTRLTMNNVSGYMEDTTFINVSTELLIQVSAGPRIQSLAPLSLIIEQIDPGIPVSDIHASYQLDTQDTTLALSNISARIFDGTISTPSIHYDWSNPDTRVNLTLQRIDLARALQLGAYEGVKATGLISGEVPLRYHDRVVSVTGGKLLADAPGGSIRYNSFGAQSGNASLDLVNQALSNYQYNVMETSVSYDEDGELSLLVKLQGQNPDMNKGQKINLNLNITDNIPKLLESLQSSRSITDALERALNER
jgi:hypothetical protein